MGIINWNDMEWHYFSVKRDEKLMAVRTFSGGSNEEKFQAEKNKLLEFLKRYQSPQLYFFGPTA